MSTVAITGGAGLVLRGAIRDSAALAEVRVGVQALGATPRKSGKAGRGAIGVPSGARATLIG
ncbi:RraA family protein [Streptomyces sp. NPDC001700]